MEKLIYNKYEIGQRIRKLRISLDFSQMQFAESIDISVPFLSEIENGKKSMSQEILHRICSIHQVSADYLLFGYEVNTDSQIMVELEQIPSCYHYIIIEYIHSISKFLENEKESS